MGNCLIAFPDRTLSASSITGGNWVGLERLKDDKRGSLIQSVNLLPASTQFIVDLGREVDLRLISLLDHNASATAQVRVRVGIDPTFVNTLFDSGWVPFWFTFYPQGSLPWGHPSFWDGGSCPEEDMAGFPRCRYFELTKEYSISARFVKVEIDDQANPAGYFHLSRCFISSAWQPPVNMAYGAQIQWDDSATTLSTSKGGADYFGIQPKRRVCNFSFESSNAVGVAWFMEMQRKLGISQELFFVFDPDDATMLEQSRTFLARFKTLSPLEFPYFDRTKQGFQLREKIQ